MTKLLITEKLITNKQDFIKFSNIPDTVEFVKYSEISSKTTASLFEENNIKFIYDQFVNFRDLSNNNYKFSSNCIFQIKKNSLSKFSEVSEDIEVIEGSIKDNDKFLPWDLSNIIFNKKQSLSNEVISKFCSDENLFRQFISYLNKELLRINLLNDNDVEKISQLLDEKIDFKYELAERRLSNISKANLEKSFLQLKKIEMLMNKSRFNQENNKRFVVGVKQLLEF
jgi:hypothetical protein